MQAPMTVVRSLEHYIELSIPVLICLFLCAISFYGVMRIAQVPYPWVRAKKEIAELGLVVPFETIGVVHDSNREQNETPVSLCEISQARDGTAPD